MQEIMPPVPRELLREQLRPNLRLRHTNRGGNEIYVVTYQQAPDVVREIGRLREIAFRAAGGGTGKDCDLDEFDTCQHPYYQLLVWDPENQLILGGYRFLPGDEATLDADGQPILAPSHIFRFSQRFITDFLPRTIELGRSFVTLEYQSSRAMAKGLFTLDNLWDGLGALTIILPGLKYFFGKMTMYPSFDRTARDMILFFLDKHFGDREQLVTPFRAVELETPISELAARFPESEFRADYRYLNYAVRERGYNIPPLVNAYMSLSPTMRCFGTAVNDTFGNVEETGILITEDEILEEKRRRHIDSYFREYPDGQRDLSGILMSRKKL